MRRRVVSFNKEKLKWNVIIIWTVTEINIIVGHIAGPHHWKKNLTRPLTRKQIINFGLNKPIIYK